MLALVLVGALIAHTTLGAPTNCVEFCDDQSSSGYGQTKNSYSSYVKSSYDQRSHRISNGGGLGMTGSRLENFDENVVGGIGLDRPGNWHDEKHYVTDDGRGEMSYKAGQTVTNNGFSKFAHHSYRYGTHNSHAPQSNSQILNTSDFEREFQNMRRRISNFMGNFHVESGSTMNANLLEDFKNKANLINSQLNSVCNQVDVGSSMYQQMQEMMRQFQRDVDERQREMEAMIFQTSSSSASTITHGNVHRYPSRPQNEAISQYPSRPQYEPITQYPTRPSEHTGSVMQQQRVEEEFTRVQNLISSFYTTYNRPDTSSQYQQNLNSEIESINRKLNELNYESIQNESMRTMINHLKTQFETYSSQLVNRIKEIEQRQKDEEARRQERQRQLELEKKVQEEKMRQLELERIRMQQEAEERKRLQIIEEERIRLQQEQERLRKQQEELDRLQNMKPQVTGKVEISGSSTYEHTVSGNYGSQVQGSTTSPSGQYTHNVQGNYQTSGRPQPVVQPHVDLTAAMTRLQQDLHRLQNEVNSFNMYTMRLTSSNSATVITEAERQAEQLRQSINNLCETSSRYQNRNVQKNAEDLSRRFEELFRSFQNHAANYSSQTSSEFSSSGSYASGSGYSTSGSYGAVHAPKITNVEIEHSKSTEIEVGRRPASSSHYSSGSGYSASSGYSSQSAYGSQSDNPFKSGVIEIGQGSSDQQQIECVEMYAGQPCVSQPRRYRRNIGEIFDYSWIFPAETTDYMPQQYQPIFNNFDYYGQNKDFESYTSQLEDYSQRTETKLDSLTHDSYFNSGLDDFSQNTDLTKLHQKYQPLRNKHYFNHKIEDLTYQQGASDDYYTRQNLSDQINGSLKSDNLKQEQKGEDLSQQYINSDQKENFDSFEKSRNYNINDKNQLSVHENLQVDKNSQEFINESHIHQNYSSQYESLNSNEKFLYDQLATYSKLGYKEKSEKRQFSRPTIEKLESLQKYAFENSGFNDNFDRNLNFNEKTESKKSENTKPILISGKVKPQNLGLETSGFNDYQINSENLELSENPLTVQPLGILKKSEPKDLTKEKSDFIDYLNEDRKLELNDKLKQAYPSELEKPNQRNEDLTQQNSFGNFYNSNNKEKKFSDSDLIQQTAGQIDFGAESQMGRQIFQQDISKLNKFDSNYDNVPQNPRSKYFQLNNQNEQNTEKHLPQPNQSLNSQKSNVDQLNYQFENDNVETGIFTTTSYQGPISTVRPIVRPAPKPIPRYTRPWQVSQIHSVPKNFEREPEVQNKSTSALSPVISKDINQTNADSHSASLRGDLPGNSESSTPSLIIEKPILTNQQSYFDYSQQHHEQVNLDENKSNYSHKLKNDSFENNKENIKFNQSDQTYNSRQSLHQNYEYSQQSTYNQHRDNNNLSQQIQNPSRQENNYNQFDYQEPTEFKQEGSIYQIHDQQIRNLEIRPDQPKNYNSNPIEFNQNSHLEFYKQNNFTQQNQQTSFEQDFSQIEQKTNQKLEDQSKINNNERVISLEELRPIDTRSEIEPSTTPHSFWKRIGHKLSNTYDKAKEKARTIFG